MFQAAAPRRERLVGGVLALGLQVGVGLILLYGLAAPVIGVGVQTALTSLDLRAAPPPPPPPPPVPRHGAKPRRAAAAAPPGRLAQASPVVAPPVPLFKPPPVPTAPVAGQGIAANAGAAAQGNGSGAGGSGAGTGAGGEGNGDGGGGGSSAELVSARIKPSDTPEDIRNAPNQITTKSLVLIDAKGAFRDCRPLGSSGNAGLDALICRLIRERFRFRPARDRAGQAVPGEIVYEHDWEVGGAFDSDEPH